MADVSEKVDRFFTPYPKHNHPKGHILIMDDENPESIFYITKGRVRTYQITEKGDEVVVNVFKSLSFFPMSWPVAKVQNRYFYKTETDCELHAAPAQEALEFVQKNPDVMLDLLARVYQGVEGLMGRVVQLMSGSARSRLLYELIIECRRHGVKQPDGSYVIDLKESDLAARAGLSRETVSREIRQINEGLILADGKVMTVKSIELLQEKFGAQALVS